jgi:hypothetical protein
MKTHMPIHEPELAFGHPGRNFDDTPEHFDHRDDRYEPPPVDPPEEGIVHYGPGDRPLCGRESPFAIYTFEPDQVAGCQECLELVDEDLHPREHTTPSCRPSGTRRGTPGCETHESPVG